MTHPYLTPDDPGAFLDREALPQGSFKRKCGRCKGYGGWNLRLHAYPPVRPGEPRRHFKACCTSCCGYGWTNDECEHAYRRAAPIGNCLHHDKCAKCGKTITVDSSG